MMRVSPVSSPPFWVVAPFFLAAPLGLMAAGFGMMRAGEATFWAPNVPHNVAITHALVLGWVSMIMMGALYQLGPAVLGTPVRSYRVARIQFWLHLAGVTIFATALWEWDVRWIGLGGSLAFASIALFVWNTLHLRGDWRKLSLSDLYVRVGQCWLLVAASVGITYAGNHEHGWFMITPGRLAAHAHLGLIGWIGIVLMGVSYQLVPMFNVIHDAKPRLGVAALAVTSAALALFAATMIFDPGRLVRLLLAAGIAVGVGMWAVDLLRLMLARSRRKIDIQGRSTLVSLAFLALAALLGLGAAWGSPFTADLDYGRWPVAYGVAGIAGWAGIAIIGNSHKILPFLIWYHRYRPRMGREPVPMLKDIYRERLATVILAVHSAGVVLVVASALLALTPLLHAGGAFLLASGALHALSYGLMLAPRRIRAARPAVAHSMEVR